MPLCACKTFVGLIFAVCPSIVGKAVQRGPLNIMQYNQLSCCIYGRNDLSLNDLLLTFRSEGCYSWLNQ